MNEPGPIAIGVDVGGSGIKAAAVDTARGVLASERLRVPTPSPSTPAAVIASIFRLVKRIEASVGTSGLPLGVDFPAVVLGGKTMTAANVDRGWIGYPAVEHLERALGRRVALINDADAAGLAEMRFGAGAGRTGVVLVLTLGTGVGSGLFVDGVLVPNTELGHMEIRGRDAERRSAAAARVRRGISWKAWAEDVDEHLGAIDRILWPDLIILGGGVSKNADRFIPRLTCRPPVVPAVLRNEAGMVGAAMYALEHFGDGAPSQAIGAPPDAGEAEPGAVAEAAPEAEPGLGPGAEAEPAAEAAAEAESAAEAEPTAEPEAQAERTAELQPESGPETPAEPEPVTTPEAGPPPEPEPVAPPEAEAEPPAETDWRRVAWSPWIGDSERSANVSPAAPPGAAETVTPEETASTTGTEEDTSGFGE